MQLHNIEKIAGPVRPLLEAYFNDLEKTGVIDVIDSFCIIGSAAMDEYTHGKSDVDFAAILKRPLTQEEIDMLNIIHSDTIPSFNIQFDGFLIPRSLLQAPDPAGPQCFSCFNSFVHPNELNFMHWVTFFQIKMAAIFLYGEPPEFEIDLEKLKRHLYYNINDDWARFMKQQSLARRNGLRLLVYPYWTEFCVLKIARYLYILKKNTFPGKLEGALYLLNQLPPKFHGIINTAINNQTKKRNHISISFSRHRKTILLMREVIKRFNDEYKTKAGV